MKKSSFMWPVLVVCFLQVCSGQNFQDQFLNPHNAARAQQGVEPLTWDDTVAAYAQNYADQRKGDCALQHSGGQYGENLFIGTGSGFTPADAVNAWVNEEKPFYDYNSNSCAAGKQCGHYTQVMWRNTHKLGCARDICNNGNTFIICSYDPPGNVVGEKPW